MTMTRQHFKFLADVIRDLDTPSTGFTSGVLEHVRGVLAEQFAERLPATNPGFKPKRFLRACGVED